MKEGRAAVLRVLNPSGSVQGLHMSVSGCAVVEDDPGSMSLLPCYQALIAPTAVVLSLQVNFVNMLMLVDFERLGRVFAIA